MQRISSILIGLVIACSSIQAKKLFVEMEFTHNTIKIDDGTSKKPQTIKGEDGKDLKFLSIVSALNYMSLSGWELVDIKPVITGDGYVGVYGGGNSTRTKLYYILYKEVLDEELEQVVKNGYKRE